MNKQFQKIKTFMIFTLILCSSLLVICPIIKSAPLDTYFKCEPVLIIEYNETLLEDPIVPLEEARKIPVTIKMKIRGPGADIVAKNTKGVDFIVKLYIDEFPEGCHAAITPPLVRVKMSKEIARDYLYENATVSIVVNQILPALTKERVIVRMESKPLGRVVKRGNITQELPFTVGYYPLLGVSIPKGNVKNIHHDETASFPIELENMGNGNTEVISEVIDIPKGWIAEIMTSTTLGSNLLGGSTKKTITLKIKPPIDLGYHEERAVIKVTITPTYYKTPKFEGEPHYLSFIVQSRGFSTPGFDIITLLLAFILVMFLIWKRKNYLKKNKQFKRRKI